MLSRRATIDVAIGLAGFGYVVMVFWTNLQCPLFAWLFLVVAGYQLIKGRSGKREGSRSRLLDWTANRSSFLVSGRRPHAGSMHGAGHSVAPGVGTNADAAS